MSVVGKILASQQQSIQKQAESPRNHANVCMCFRMFMSPVWAHVLALAYPRMKESPACAPKLATTVGAVSPAWCFPPRCNASRRSRLLASTTCTRQNTLPLVLQFDRVNGQAECGSNCLCQVLPRNSTRYGMMTVSGAMFCPDRAAPIALSSNCPAS